MNSYLYRVTVEALTDARGQLVDGRSLSFEVANHDDLLSIVERVRTRDLGLSRPLDQDEAAAMVLGMKLLGEVALAHRKDGFFAAIGEVLGQFVRELKTKPEAVQRAGLEGNGG